MSGNVIAYVGVKKSIIVLELDTSEGPYVPLSIVSDIGLALITAANVTAGRNAIQAAGRGVNGDITQIVGMSPVLTATEVLTPQGTANAGVLAEMLGGIFQISSVTKLTGAATADATWGIVWADASAGAFPITVPRTLDRSFMVLKTDASSNPVSIVDDLGAPVFTLLTGRQAFALVSVSDNVVVAGGVQ